MLKPINENTFFEVFAKAVAKVDSEVSIVLRTADSIVRISTNEVCFCEVINHTLNYHISDKRVIKAIGTFQELEDELLARPGFIKPHRSYLVNVRYVRNVTKREVVVLSGESIPLARGRYDEICYKFLSAPFGDD